MQRQRQSSLALAMLRNVRLFRSPGPPQALHIDGTTSPPRRPLPRRSLFDLKPNGCTPLRFLLNKTHTLPSSFSLLSLYLVAMVLFKVIGLETLFLLRIFLD
jgi:hypothetical protein